MAFPTSPRVVAPVLALIALAVVIFVPRETTELAISTFRLERVPSTPLATPWRSGHSFVVQLELTLPGYPLLFHVNSRGIPVLLHPPTVDTPLSVVAGEIPTRLPRGTASWKLKGEPGTETYLMAVSSRPEVNLRELESRVREAAASASSPEEAVVAVRQLLEEASGPVRTQTLQIQP